MAFYSDFAGHYEKVFPYRETVFEFLDAHLPRGGRLLDVGCGTGRYCHELGRTGRQCLGIDLDPGMITEAERSYAEIDYRILGMEEIQLLPAGQFNGVFCIGNVLPHLQTADLPGFLQTVRRLLTPGGAWIFQTVNFDPILNRREHEFPELVFPEENVVFRRRYAAITSSEIKFRTSLDIRGFQVFEGEVSLYPQTSADYLDRHREAGFVLQGHYADFAGKPFDPDQDSGSVFVFNDQV